MHKKEIIKIIGNKNLGAFEKFMFGQTVGVYPDGSTNFYEWDVSRFCYQISKGKEFEEWKACLTSR